jgi:hypothetical protein
MLLSFPKYIRTSAGVRNTPMRFEIALLKTALASSPPAVPVNTMAIFGVIGRQDAIKNPSAKSADVILRINMSLVRPNVKEETTRKLKIWTARLNCVAPCVS